MGKVYKITNLLNGRVYVGQTSKSIDERWNSHVRDSQRKNFYLYRAMRKYGSHNFQIEEICDVGFDSIDSVEKKYIDELNSMYPSGYNMTEGGGGTRGHKFTKGPLSEEHKRKVSEAKKGKPMSDAHKLKMSLAHTGRRRGPMSEEHKLKISLANRRRHENKLEPNSH